MHMTVKHAKSLATEPKEYECDFDGRFFSTKDRLYVHMKTHLPKVKCKICCKMITVLGLNNHISQTHSTKRNFQCNICSKSFKTKQFLKIHQQIHDKKFQCEICKLKFAIIARLKEHIANIHENPRSFECEICNKKFNRKQNLENHQITHDKNRIKPFKCQQCEYAADFKVHLEKHQKFHEKLDKKIAGFKNPQKCEKCPTVCKNKATLKKHIFNVHPEKLFQCDLCGNYLKTKGILTTHIIDIHLRNLAKLDK